MDIKLNQKVIKNLCGTVSFKRGDVFYRADKVKLTKYSGDVCEAIVSGAEEFQVIVEKEDEGGFRAKCTCPKLASVKSECQHIAAVLLAIHDKQQNEISLNSQSQTNPVTNQDLAQGFLSIFNNQPRRTSGHQLHFETRNVLNVEFGIKPVEIGTGLCLLGIELKIGPIEVRNVRDFLKTVKEKKPYPLSRTFIYDSNLHCFEKETDEIINQLITIIQDEKVYVDTLPNGYVSKSEMLLIPPSSWGQILPLLTSAPLMKLEYNKSEFNGLQVSDAKLPLQFNFEETELKNYRLKIDGLNQMVVLDSYDSVLFQGQLIQLKNEDCSRLFELKQLLAASRTDEIPIHKEQIGFFVEKVVPGLRRLGVVKINGDITKEFLKTPLVAKLYLDRVNNRLLAGLEFHYEAVVLNPLESRELPGGSLLIRDLEKEESILQLMEDSLFAKTDGGYYLQNEELEYEFLYHIVPKLQKLVQIFATTAIRNRIFREKTIPQIRVKVKKERTNWLEFKFEMDGIPEKQIRELLEALEEKRKYFRLRNGSLLSLETKEFEEIQRFLNAGPIQNEDLEKGLNMPIVRGLQLLDSIQDQNIFIIEETFRHFLEDISNPNNQKFDIPASLQPKLRDYQKQGYQWLKTLASYGFGGILADDMGLGKTLQSITYISSVLPDIRERKLPVLVVCPSSLTYNWLNEFMKFTPEIQAIIVDGKQTERSSLLKDLTHTDVVITSYMLLRRDIHLYEKMSFHTVFFDEAQAFKNPVTQTAKAVIKIQADHRFALTGTPVENSIEELWSIFRVVFPELFQGLKEYSNLTRKTIARRVRPFMLRRLKEEVLAELPGKIESLHTAELLPDQKKLYAAYLAKLRHKTMKNLDKDTIRKNRIKILSGLTRLRQICCHPALFVDGYRGSSAKFEQLLQIIEESKLAGRRVLIFSQFTKMLGLIGRELNLQELPYFYLDGQTPSEERVETCNRFNEGERDFFLISLKAGGTGLNLTGADTVILYDLWWNPAVEEQAADRAHRMGQKNTVQVIKLIARGTIEEKMNELQDKKRNMIEEIIEERASTTLTEEDIREILMI